MYTFYNEMKGQIIDFSILTKKTILSDDEIKNLKPYQDASQDIKDDFDSSVLSGGLSRGMPKAKTKALSSPYSSAFTAKEETYELEYPDIKDTISTSPYYKEKQNSTEQVISEPNNIISLPAHETTSQEEHSNIQTVSELNNIVTLPSTEPKPKTEEYLDIQTISKPNKIKSIPTLDATSQPKETNIQSSPYYYVPTEVDPIEHLVA